MKKDKPLATNSNESLPPGARGGKVQSLQETTGATAAQIRKAIELLGFDREKVEQYLIASPNK